MKRPIPKSAAIPQVSVFPPTLHRVRTRGQDASSNPATPKRDNIFSKSRDTREDRGTRQMKTSHVSKTIFRDGGNSGH
jgi:hypothetical protein